jgi:hypothetical protein
MKTLTEIYIEQFRKWSDIAELLTFVPGVTIKTDENGNKYLG